MAATRKMRRSFCARDRWDSAARSSPSSRSRRIDARSSPLAGKTLGEAQIGSQSGAIVVGEWSRSRLNATCDGELRIEPGALLELVGDAASLDRAATLFGASYMRRNG